MASAKEKGLLDRSSMFRQPLQAVQAMAAATQEHTVSAGISPRLCNPDENAEAS